MKTPRIRVTEAPEKEPISLEEAKLFLRVDGNAEDTLVEALIATAREHVEGWTRRALITQTIEVTWDSAPGPVITIPRPPLQEVEAIEVVDDNGSRSEVSTDLYQVDSSGTGPARIRLVSGGMWPYHRGFGSFIVRVVVGYGDDGEDVPVVLRAAILQAVAHLHEKREATGIPEAVLNMASFYRVNRL